MSEAAILDTLRRGFTEPVRDALWGHIYLTAELEALIRSPPFMRLYRVMQLGPAVLCYPGATHTRAAHSIGVYHLARRLLFNLAERGAAAWMTPCGARSMLCAALMHDLGHFPFAHSLKELSLTRHEILSGLDIAAEPLRGLVGKTGADPDLAAAIVDTSRPVNGNTELVFYRKLLSGALDPDKLDYLNRDARYCGVPYGAQDVDYIFSILSPHPERGIEIDSRGIASIEDVLFSKYLMYRSVYWHHSVRSATAMIKKALFMGLKDQSIKTEDLYELDDDGLFALLASCGHPVAALGAMARAGRLYTVAMETPFDKARHCHLEDINRRTDYEAALARQFSEESGKLIEPYQVIIDIPEETLFETELFVRDENCVFGESSSFFKAPAVAAFVQTLRIIRVFVDGDPAILRLARQEGTRLLTLSSEMSAA